MKKTILYFFMVLLMILPAFSLAYRVRSEESLKEPPGNYHKSGFWDRFFAYFGLGGFAIAKTGETSPSNFKGCNDFVGFKIMERTFRKTNIVSIGDSCAYNSLVVLLRCADGEICKDRYQEAIGYKIAGINPTFSGFREGSAYAYSCYNCNVEGGNTDCLLADPLYVCKKAGIQLSGYKIDSSLTCPSHIPVCWIPDTVATTPCEKIEEMGYSNCHKHYGGLCSADDKYYCSDDYIFYAFDGSEVVYFCAVSGAIRNPSIMTCPNGCANGKCQEQVCFPGYEWCEDNRVYRCSQDGMDISQIDTCTSSEECIEHSPQQASCDLKQKRWRIVCMGDYCYCSWHSSGEYDSKESCEAALAAGKKPFEPPNEDDSIKLDWRLIILVVGASFAAITLFFVVIWLFAWMKN